MLDFFRDDVIFLHPPSVLDFRRNAAFFGPVSDVIPSSSVFEMYPVGITSIADRLERAGFQVRIINLAYRMLRDPDYHPDQVIRRYAPRLWAIDLHWLPHADGALALAELIKRYHPGTPVLMGGLSASYFHEELASSPHVDYVIRGDSTEEPVRELLSHLRRGAPLHTVPNLTWKKPDGMLIVNPLSHVPATLDEVQIPAYRYIMRSVFKYWNLYNIVPYLRWLQHPMAALLTARGCTQNCSVCGGSQAAYRQICGRGRPAFRSPARLLDDVRFITRFSRAPIFVIHDIRMPGRAFTRQLLDLLGQEQISNEMIFELFFPGNDAFFSSLHKAFPRYSLELTLETHDPRLRVLNGKFPYPNEHVERTIAAALRNGCRRLDLFFMVGIPRQTRESALESVEYARTLLDQYGRDGRLRIYVAPLAPFLDPGSLAFEHADLYGYRLRAKTLKEHRELLSEPSWGRILNYESDSMPRTVLVDTVYDAVERLTQVKAEFGLLSPEAAAETAATIAGARTLVHAIEEACALPEPERSQTLDGLRRQAKRANRRRLYAQKEFISWGDSVWQFKPLGLMMLMAELFFEEAGLAIARLKR